MMYRKIVMVIPQDHYYDVQEESHGDTPGPLSLYPGRQPLYYPRTIIIMYKKTVLMIPKDHHHDVQEESHGDTPGPLS